MIASSARLRARAMQASEDRLALQPGHGEQAARAEPRHRLGHGDARLALEHVPVQRHVARLEGVVELLAQPRLELGAHAAHGERLLVLLQDAQRNVEAAQIGIDRGVHVRVLQLAGERAAVVADGAMHLAERGRGRRRQLEVAKAAPPVRAELARHAPAHEAAAPSAAPATAG